MTKGLSPSAQRIQEALRERGKELGVVELPQSTRTAVEAAAAIGCTVAQIAKSILFRGAAGAPPVLVVASGVNRISEKKVAALLGRGIEKADADYVRERTGFAIGGIPPCGHAQRIDTVVDRDLLELGEIWAPAGTLNAVFRLSADDLVELTGGRVADVRG